MDLSPFVSPALISALILAGALVLFVTERVRHDLIAVLAQLEVQVVATTALVLSTGVG
ncbi:hypothetical protein [Asticcacaulis excentricus]|uniref:TrkA-C domain protein n=1 Tax=Asticcacaulis excentricus TaxID=78587 RepID=A0A3G9G4E6_9CAUL|nr:hypothetical protein [Asticcacaulis excentricus]BBF81536.1 TrkA-C domain protein [Asticcacaulis excentricus]